MANVDETNVAVIDQPDTGEGLVIEDLHVNVEGREILKGVSLTVRRGEVHALMGPNGSGKSTLVNALMGNPNYEITSGRATLDGVDLLDLDPDERAKVGLFLGFQYPSSIPGVSVANFIRTALVSLSKPRARSEQDLLTETGEIRRDAEPAPEMGGLAGPNYVGRGGVRRSSPAVKEFRKNLREKLALLKMDESFATRYVNDGFSGGEKKRLEVLQMAMLKPKIAMLDEPDSGLDIDAVRVVAEGINSLRGPGLGTLIVTHYQRILNYIKPEFVHVMVNGRIVQSGGPELAQQLEAQGYDWLRPDEGDVEDRTMGGTRDVEGEDDNA
ncbi:MAG: ATP-binding cassette domain-containing protein [Chloroflexota bacterium]|nr:ATP-binding cassette domain-containing protein [Chloroflexota bacterium]MDQ5867710.1 ATP-binding cassette domain-containing protein [Chloroflexota bacterium]